MRFQGTITFWNAPRGYGYISPAQGGEDLFVRAKACRSLGDVPLLGQVVTFELQTRSDGRKRAVDVQPVLAARPSAATRAVTARLRRRGVAQWRTASFFALPAFLLLYLLLSLSWGLPDWVAWWYLGMGVLAFAHYGLDKFAASRGLRRQPEATLLWVGLAGGWPGAVVAQQVWRHKSSKASFMTLFWVTAVVNTVLLVWASSPSGRAWLDWLTGLSWV